MNAQRTPAIAVDRLVKRYKGVGAVDGISFKLPAGSVTGLLGGNGAGKTTTIAMIMGLVTPTSGAVRVLGAEMPRERYRVLHRVNFESPYMDMPHRLTIRQNLNVFGRLYAVEDLDGRIRSLAEELDRAHDLLVRDLVRVHEAQQQVAAGGLVALRQLDAPIRVADHRRPALAQVLEVEVVERAVLVELGHVLGLNHNPRSRLMSTDYVLDKQGCVDKVTVETLASHKQLPLNELNWCVLPAVN